MPVLDLERSYRLRDQFLRMEWFRPLRTARFPDEELATTPGGTPYYYAGNLGTIASISGAFPPLRSGTERASRTLGVRLRKAWEHTVETGTVPDWRPRVTLITFLTGQPHYRTRHIRVPVRLRNGRDIRRGAHVLVLVAWLGPPGTGDVETDYWMDGCHEDGRPRNNRLRNLLWGDRRMNAQQRERHRREREVASGIQTALTFGAAVGLDNLVDLDAERERRAERAEGEPDDLADIPF